MLIRNLTFELTCFACPEQYDVRLENGKQVGYVRLRGGNLSACCPDVGGTVVYRYTFDDQWKGLFDSEEEQAYHLEKIADRIWDWVINGNTKE